MNLREVEAQSGERRDVPAARLEVYVAGHCLACAEARRMAAAAASRFPGLQVCTVDVDALPSAGQPTGLPEGVVAVPTYLLDGAVVALGNPDPEALFARIAVRFGWTMDQNRGATCPTLT